MRFSSEELTLDIDDFSSRYIEPAMARMAAGIENDAFSMIDKVYPWVDGGTSVSMANVLSSQKNLQDYLAGPGPHTAILDTQANVDLVDSLKGLFQDSKEIAKQYLEGMIGRTGGFDFYQNTLIPNHTTGAEGGGSNYDVNGGSQTSTDAKSMTLNIDTGTATIQKGDVFTIAGVNRVHPESKIDTGELQTFVAGEDNTGANTAFLIYPGIVDSGPRQNVSAAPADGAAITFKGSASTAYKRSVFFAEDAFTFATADLVLPRGLDFASREAYDGISIRILRDYAIVKDVQYTRCDVLYGYTPLYKQLASVLWHE